MSIEPELAEAEALIRICFEPGKRHRELAEVLMAEYDRRGTELDRRGDALVEAESRLDGQAWKDLTAERDSLRHFSAALRRLAPLCVCDHDPDTTDGPQQDCPIHGDGVTFVAEVNNLRRGAAARSTPGAPA